MFVNANLLSRNLEAAQTAEKSVSIREHMQRYTIANLSEIILGVDFGVCNPPRVILNSELSITESCCPCRLCTVTALKSATSRAQLSAKYSSPYS
jgi:hypothetical protein